MITLYDQDDPSAAMCILLPAPDLPSAMTNIEQLHYNLIKAPSEYWGMHPHLLCGRLKGAAH